MESASIRQPGATSDVVLHEDGRGYEKIGTRGAKPGQLEPIPSVSMPVCATRGQVRTGEDAGRLSRNREFESGSLQQRVGRTSAGHPEW
jgi:hypothetical protein